MNADTPSSKPAILLVDDDPRALLATEGHLESDACEIVTARSGAEALLRLREPREFALVLLDVRMPVMDGFAVARAMKAEARLALIPICFLTASLTEQADMLRGYDVGAMDLLNKPVNPYLLRAKVAVLVNLWRTTRELAAANHRLVAEVAERERAAEIIKASLAEKEVLLREIHHRVKNNLQVVSGLLLLQSGQVNDPALKAIFSEVEVRVRSMALVHERLYSEHTLSNLDFANYLQTLAGELLQSISIGATVKLEADLDPVRVPVDTAIPLGLIATELVTNALKYAYKGRKEGVLKLSLKPVAEGRFELAVADDGPGLPAEFDPAKATSLGLRLVRMLSQQIGGEVVFASGPGAPCRVTFPPAGVGGQIEDRWR